jgi:DNA-binding Lrp family transcriptional regulator
MSLSAVDKKLLYELDFRARAPLSELAHRLRTSKQMLLYRFERLKQEGIIQGFYADINPSKLGLTIYLLYLKFQHMSADKEQEFIRFLNAQPRISVNASVQGKWDHSVGIFARDIHEFKAIYARTVGVFEQHIKEKRITIVTDFHYYKPKYLVPESKPAEITMSGPLESTPIDIVDDKLLKLLAENARMPLLDLGKKVDLTPNAVKARIKALEKKKVILGYRVMIDHTKLQKLHYRVFFFLENDPARQEALRAFLAVQPSVISVTKTIGYCELECRLLVDNVQDFYDFMTALKAKFTDVLKDFEPILYYKFHKSLNYYPVE